MFASVPYRPHWFVMQPLCIVQFTCSACIWVKTLYCIDQYYFWFTLESQFISFSHYWKLELHSYQSCQRYVYSCRTGYKHFCSHHLQALLSLHHFSQLLKLYDHQASTIFSKIYRIHMNNNGHFQQAHHESG